MGRKRFTVKQIINMLREAEVLINEGSTVGEVCRKVGISEQTYYRWRKEHNQFRPHSSLGYKPPAPEAIELGALTLQL
jgi:putative transposase